MMAAFPAAACPATARAGVRTFPTAKRPLVVRWERSLKVIQECCTVRQGCSFVLALR